MESSIQQARAILYSMWRKRWYGLAAAWAICLIGWLAVALIPNEYQSEARVYVRYNALLPTQLGLEKSGGQLQQVDVVRQTLTSRPNLEKVLRRTDLDLTDVSQDELDGMIGRLAENITVAPQGSDNLYRLTYTAKEPGRSDAENAALAQRVVQNLIDIFTEDNLTSNRDNLNQAIRFLDEQISQREQQLEQAEAQRAMFEAKYFDRLPGEGDINERMKQARTELDKIGQELIQTRGSLGALQAQLASTPPSIPGAMFNIPSQRATNFGTGTVYDPASPRGQIEQLQRQIAASLARGYTEKHPDIVIARQQIANLEDQAKAQPVASASDPASAYQRPAAQANPVYVNLRSLLFEKQSAAAALAARQQQLLSALADLRQKQTEAPQIVAEQAKLNRDYDVLKAGYDNLLKSREQIRLRADVANQTNEVQFRTVDPPTAPGAPIAPNRSLLMTLVLLAGLGAGLAAAFVMSQLHPAYITEEKLAEDTGLPVLGSIAEVVQQPVVARERKMTRNFAALGAGLVGFYALILLYQTVGKALIA